jgi:hypothetical protein
MTDSYGRILGFLDRDNSQETWNLSVLKVFYSYLQFVFSMCIFPLRPETLFSEKGDINIYEIPSLLTVITCIAVSLFSFRVCRMRFDSKRCTSYSRILYVVILSSCTRIPWDIAGHLPAVKLPSRLQSPVLSLLPLTSTVDEQMYSTPFDCDSTNCCRFLLLLGSDLWHAMMYKCSETDNGDVLLFGLRHSDGC